MSDLRRDMVGVRSYGGGRVGCAECGDEYWDKYPGDKCPTCGDQLIEFSYTSKERDK